MKTKYCPDCGKDLTGTHPNRVRCVSCSWEQMKAQERYRQQKKKDDAAAIGVSSPPKAPPVSGTAARLQKGLGGCHFQKESR